LNHLCKIFSRSVQELQSSDTPKLPFPTDFLRRPYNSVRTAVRHCDVYETHIHHDKHRNISAAVIRNSLRYHPLISFTCSVINEHCYAALLPRRGRILRRTLSVCPSVCPSVPLADVLCLQLHCLTTEHPK